MGYPVDSLGFLFLPQRPTLFSYLFEKRKQGIPDSGKKGMYLSSGTLGV